jgi:hypothetical protein
MEARFHWGVTHYRYRNKNITMGMIMENAPSGAKKIRKTKRKENPGTSLGPGLVGGAKILPRPPTRGGQNKDGCIKIGIKH